MPTWAVVSQNGLGLQGGAAEKANKLQSGDSEDPGAPTRVDITASALPSGHYDPKNDVILRVEAMSASETRVSHNQEHTL